MASKKLAILVGSLVAFLPDKGNRNQDGKTESLGKVIAVNEDGTYDLLLNNPNDDLGKYVHHGATAEQFRVVNEKSLTKAERELYK